MLTPGGNVVYFLKQNVFGGGRTEVLGPWVNRAVEEAEAEAEMAEGESSKRAGSGRKRRRVEAKKTETGARSQEPETISRGKMCGEGRFYCSPCLFA